MDWVYTYTDCAGNTADWTFSYTVDMPPFTLPVDDASTVNCVADAQVQPTPPAMVDLCGDPIVPVVTAPAAVACEGDMVWVFTYTDCAGNTADWLYTYTIDVPAFTIPYANGASTVNCPADGSVQPADPGVVLDECGNTLTPVVTAPAAVACEGDMVWVFTYTDCAGNTADWLYTYTIDVPAFTIPYANGASTVNCPADGSVQPADPGVVLDECGNTLTPVVTAPSAVGCTGDMVWTFTYTDCAGNTADWLYTYTVDMPAFVLPADDASTVECLAQVAVPVPPAMTDVCGNALVPVMTESVDPVCEGDKVYTFTYTDCAGNTADWVYTYTIDLTTPPVVPANGTEAVVCFADIYVPTPPVVTDACGNNITPVMTEGPDPVCVGDKVYTFTYTDCAGNVSVWTYTFSINDNVPPTASNPATVTVTTLAQVPAVDPSVVIDEQDNCTTNPIVAFVSETSDGNLCPETLTRVYSVTDDCGNQITVTHQIVITGEYPPIDAGPDETICDGESITLTATNPMGAIISWDNGVQDGVAFTPGQTLTYTVTADNLGCISTDDVTITVEELPVVSFFGDNLSGCVPHTVTFTNTSTTSGTLVDCVWDIGGVELTGCTDVTYTFNMGGTYDVTLTTTSANGCTSSVIYDEYIYVEDNPIASFNASPSSVTLIDSEVQFENTSIGAVDYLWNFGDGSPSSTIFEPSHIFPGEEPGSYVVQLIAYSALGCTDTAYMTITVEEELIFYIPNTFTPDEDEYNDVFKPVFYSGFDPMNYEMLIFNRWGEIIWESHDASIGWDGTYGGKTMQDGTYVWKIQFKTSMNDEHKQYTGHVNIIR
jgi:gliding motility-associated-like protein